MTQIWSQNVCSWLLVFTKYFLHPTSTFPQNVLCQTSIKRDVIFSDTKLFYVKESFQQIFPIWRFSFKERVFIFIASAFNWFKRNQQSYLVTKYSYAPRNGRNTFWERSLGNSVLLTSQSARPKPSGTASAHLGHMSYHPLYLQSGVD